MPSKEPRDVCFFGGPVTPASFLHRREGVSFDLGFLLVPLAIVQLVCPACLAIR